MNDKAFLDTNMVLYLYSSTEIGKKRIIEELLEQTLTFHISTQVINEFINVMSKKKKLSIDVINLAIDELSTAFVILNINFSTIKLALSIANKNKYAYFDSLIIASALENDCVLLYSEDMHHTHLIDNQLKISNPFFPNQTR